MKTGQRVTFIDFLMLNVPYFGVIIHFWRKTEISGVTFAHLLSLGIQKISSRVKGLELESLKWDTSPPRIMQ